MLRGFQPKIHAFKNCSRSELIRLTLAEQTRLCICGLRHEGRFWNILVLDDPKGPYLINVIGDFGLSDEFEDRTAVSYGTEYRLEIIPTSSVDIDGGPLSSVPGCLIVREKEIGITYKRSDGVIGTFNPATGEHFGERGYLTATFSNWRVVMPIEDDWKTVYEFDAQMMSGSKN